MVELRRYLFFENAKIWVGRTMLNGEKKKRMAKAVLGLGLCKWQSWETPLETFTAPVSAYKCINTLFMHSDQCLFNSSFHNYNTGSKHKLLEGGDIGLHCRTFYIVLILFYPVLQCILYCNIHIFKALVFILITYYSLA